MKKLTLDEMNYLLRLPATGYFLLEECELLSQGTVAYV